jgi:hypothetical protein
MNATRFAVNNPQGAASLAAELRIEQYRNAHRRLDQGLRRWPTFAISHRGSLVGRRGCDTPPEAPSVGK